MTLDACPTPPLRESCTLFRHPLRGLIEAIPEEDWTPVPYWMDGAADVAETTYTPFQGEPEAAIRYLKHGVGLNHLPSGRFAANGAWLAVQVLAHNLARWTARIGLGEGVVTTRTLRRRFFSLAGRLTRSARRLTLHLPQGWPWEPVHSRSGSIESPAIACLTAPTVPDPSTTLPNRPTESHRPGPRLSSHACCRADPSPAPLPRTAIGAPNDNQRPPPAPFIAIERGPPRPTALAPCSNPKAAPHRWIRA